jgi:hypothetical protein
MDIGSINKDTTYLAVFSSEVDKYVIEAIGGDKVSLSSIFVFIFFIYYNPSCMATGKTVLSYVCSIVLSAGIPRDTSLISLIFTG